MALPLHRRQFTWLGSYGSRMTCLDRYMLLEISVTRDRIVDNKL